MTTHGTEPFSGVNYGRGGQSVQRLQKRKWNPFGWSEKINRELQKQIRQLVQQHNKGGNRPASVVLHQLRSNTT